MPAGHLLEGFVNFDAMQQNKKRRTAFIVARLILSYLAVIAFSLAGVLLGDGLSQKTRDALGVPALILLAVLVLLLALSWAGAYFYKKSKYNTQK